MIRILLYIPIGKTFLAYSDQNFVSSAGSKRRCQMQGSRLQVSDSRVQVPGVRFETQVPGSMCQVPVDFYTSSDVFRGFFGHIVTCKTSNLREAVTHRVTVTVTPY